MGVGSRGSQGLGRESGEWGVGGEGAQGVGSPERLTEHSSRHAFYHGSSEAKTDCFKWGFLSMSFVFFIFSGPHLWHMEVPRLGVESELQLLVYTTAPAAQDLSLICDQGSNPPPHGS